MMNKIKNFLSTEVTYSRCDCLVILAGTAILSGCVQYFSKQLDKEIDENMELIVKQTELEHENKMLKLKINSLLNDENK